MKWACRFQNAKVAEVVTPHDLLREQDQDVIASVLDVTTIQYEAAEMIEVLCRFNLLNVFDDIQATGLQLWPQPDQ